MNFTCLETYILISLDFWTDPSVSKDDMLKDYLSSKIIPPCVFHPKSVVSCDGQCENEKYVASDQMKTLMIEQALNQLVKKGCLSEQNGGYALTETASSRFIMKATSEKEKICKKFQECFFKEGDRYYTGTPRGSGYFRPQPSLQETSNERKTTAKETSSDETYTTARNKSSIKAMIEFMENNQIIILKNKQGQELRFSPLYVTARGNRIFAILEPLFSHEFGTDVAFLFKYTHQWKGWRLVVEEKDREEIFQEYYAEVNQTTESGE